MTTNGITTPTVEVNNDIIAIVPNSLVSRGGKGTKTVRPQSSGGGNVEMVISEDATTKKSYIKFELMPTSANIDLIKSWQDSITGVAIGISDSSYNESYRNMVMINDPDLNLTAEGTIECQFEGNPVA